MARKHFFLWLISGLLFCTGVFAFRNGPVLSIQGGIMNKITSPVDGDYLSPLYYAVTHRDSLEKHIPPGLFYQIIAADYSYVGDYQNTLKYWDLQEDTNRTVLQESDKTLLSQLKALDAREYILKRTLTEKVVMFNEAHHLPIHRAFVISLLEKLRSQGFDYLAMESLREAEVNNTTRRGYANMASSNYAMEPLHSELINTALKLGFKLVAYEGTIDGTNNMNARKQREVDEATNLSNLIKKNPSARIVVFAGYGHIYENTSIIKMMAQLFQEYSGINPLTIDQVEMTEHSSPAFERPEYDYLLKKHSIHKPTILLDQHKPYLSRPDLSTDLEVVFPRTEYVQGRPAWLTLWSNKKEFKFVDPINALDKSNEWIIIQAFKSTGYDKMFVPADQVIVDLTRSKIEEHSLYLSPGDYLLRVATLNNKELYSKSVTIQ
jgi:hypothetical protein